MFYFNPTSKGKASHIVSLNLITIFHLSYLQNLNYILSKGPRFTVSFAKGASNEEERDSCWMDVFDPKVDCPRLETIPFLSPPYHFLLFLGSSTDIIADIPESWKDLEESYTFLMKQKAERNTPPDDCGHTASFFFLFFFLISEISKPLSHLMLR